MSSGHGNAGAGNDFRNAIRRHESAITTDSRWMSSGLGNAGAGNETHSPDCNRDNNSDSNGNRCSDGHIIGGSNNIDSSIVDSIFGSIGNSIGNIISKRDKRHRINIDSDRIIENKGNIDNKSAGALSAPAVSGWLVGQDLPANTDLGRSSSASVTPDTISELTGASHSLARIILAKIRAAAGRHPEVAEVLAALDEEAVERELELLRVEEERELELLEAEKERRTKKEEVVPDVTEVRSPVDIEQEGTVRRGEVNGERKVRRPEGPEATTREDCGAHLGAISEVTKDIDKKLEQTISQIEEELNQPKATDDNSGQHSGAMALAGKELERTVLRPGEARGEQLIVCGMEENRKTEPPEKMKGAASVGMFSIRQTRERKGQANSPKDGVKRLGIWRRFEFHPNEKVPTVLPADKAVPKSQHEGSNANNFGPLASAALAAENAAPSPEGVDVLRKKKSLLSSTSFVRKAKPDETEVFSTIEVETGAASEAFSLAMPTTREATPEETEVDKNGADLLAVDQAGTPPPPGSVPPQQGLMQPQEPGEASNQAQRDKQVLPPTADGTPKGETSWDPWKILSEGPITTASNWMAGLVDESSEGSESYFQEEGQSQPTEEGDTRGTPDVAPRAEHREMNPGPGILRPGRFAAMSARNALIKEQEKRARERSKRNKKILFGSAALAVLLIAFIVALVVGIRVARRDDTAGVSKLESTDGTNAAANDGMGESVGTIGDSAATYNVATTSATAFVNIEAAEPAGSKSEIADNLPDDHHKPVLGELNHDLPPAVTSYTQTSTMIPMSGGTPPSEKTDDVLLANMVPASIPSLSPSNNPIGFPTESPASQPSTSPSNVPPLQNYVCTSDMTFKDNLGRDCSWYVAPNVEFGCDKGVDTTDSTAETGSTRWTACCFCGGGTMKAVVPSTPPPSPLIRRRLWSP
ncbi:hypothetical protein ACHAWF_014326 [Thalassiosira exigua]